MCLLLNVATGVHMWGWPAVFPSMELTAQSCWSMYFQKLHAVQGQHATVERLLFLLFCWPWVCLGTMLVAHCGCQLVGRPPAWMSTVPLRQLLQQLSDCTTQTSQLARGAGGRPLSPAVDTSSLDRNPQLCLWCCTLLKGLVPGKDIVQNGRSMSHFNYRGCISLT